MLGHSSPGVTEIYSHILPEHLHKTVNRNRKAASELDRMSCRIPGANRSSILTVWEVVGIPCGPPQIPQYTWAFPASHQDVIALVHAATYVRAVSIDGSVSHRAAALDPAPILRVRARPDDPLAIANQFHRLSLDIPST